MSWQRELGLFLRFFAGSDGFAETTGMLAVKGVRHRLGDGVRAKIVRQHRRPRHGLQHGPMRIRRRDEREDHRPFAEPDEHRVKLNRF